jgi:hypothetical protein
MRTSIVFCALLALVMMGCSREDPAAPQEQEFTPTVDLDLQGIASSVVAQAGWSFTEDMQNHAMDAEKALSGYQVVNIQRDELGDGIVHYGFEVRVGPGQYDVIGLHRVVQEKQHQRPIRTKKNIFLLHGDIKRFTGVFLPGLNSPRQPDDVGFAAYLAKAGIDVWGMDQAWALVPEATSNLDFMADWGIQRQSDDLGIALSIARLARSMTGGGNNKMLLLGYSSGAATALVYLGQEAQEPEASRNVAGFVAGDYGLVSDDPDWRAATCGDLASYESEMAAGNYGAFSPFLLFGPPSLNDPDGASALIPGLTNLMAGIGIATWPAYNGISYHYLAGIFDGNGLPTGLQYTQPDNWVDFMVYAPAWEPYAFLADYSAVICSPETVPWDDNLGDITVPVLWLGAAGGAAPLSTYTLEVIGSNDITEVIVELETPENVLLDFGHVDLFLADNAEVEVWAPTLDWIKTHTSQRNERSREAQVAGN